MSELTIDPALKGRDLFEFLVKNKSFLIAQKKHQAKRADAFRFAQLFITKDGKIVKANAAVAGNPDNLKISVAINTTNWLDSHDDVHIPGIWKKSLSDNKSFYLLQEHQMTFAGIITDQVKAFTQKMTWKELGVDASGETEVLIFNCDLEKDRNPQMFKEYQMGRVKNHSVGMTYVDMQLAINEPDDEYYKEEFSVWNKYINTIANKNDAEDQGYFWAIREAKIIEGSAVPIGSNIITPTLDNNMKRTVFDQPGDPTGKDQPQDKTMVICPSCEKSFKMEDSANCPSCGKFVSPSSTSIETTPFDFMKAVKETNFFKS